ncbi:hypothetical protein [Snodgrassella alvi]|uniref:hypothetical protein n=1 Tax=Snodgrassella alvi TaxID=1196083 RepID=UPI0015D52B3F|nr:hypothetical protein [Snodgrassella alvi]
MPLKLGRQHFRSGRLAYLRHKAFSNIAPLISYRARNASQPGCFCASFTSPCQP